MHDQNGRTAVIAQMSIQRNAEGAERSAPQQSRVESARDNAQRSIGARIGTVSPSLKPVLHNRR